MTRVSIADIRLETRRVSSEPLLVTTLSLTSEPHSLMDAVYPIRYRLRSIYGVPEGQLKAFERYKRTREIQHDMVLVDAMAGVAHLFAAEDGGVAEVPDPLQPWLSQTTFDVGPGLGLVVPAGVLDRLTLLQSVRDRLPASGQTLPLVVTNGKKLFDYQVVNEGLETLEIAGQPRECWRLRIEGFLQKDAGEPEADHEPIHVWMTADKQRIPVRFHADAALGGFTVDWVAEPVWFEVELTDKPLELTSHHPQDDV